MEGDCLPGIEERLQRKEGAHQPPSIGLRPVPGKAAHFRVSLSNIEKKRRRKLRDGKNSQSVIGITAAAAAKNLAVIELAVAVVQIDVCARPTCSNRVTQSTLTTTTKETAYQPEMNITSSFTGRP